MRLAGPWGKAAPEASPSPSERRFPCDACGAMLTFSPGTGTLVCPYCGHENHIVDEPTAAIVENDLQTALAKGLAEAPVEETRTVKCTACAAEFTFDPGRHAGQCPFCGQPVVTDTGTNRHVKPAALLPFAIPEPDARQRIANWLKGLWFAPNKLKDYARGGGRLAGMYLPYWTYDSRTDTTYSGERGTVYHEQVRVQAVRNGKRVSEIQTVQKVRWTPVSGRVQRTFDDVLVLASHSLPSWITDRLEPWDLQDLRAYSESYLAGFQSEAYQLALADGFETAKQKMRLVIQGDIQADIGGDMQRIHQMSVTHNDPTFKHILLPIWLGAFSFQGKTYRLCVNGRTGEVQGERPWSAWKIAGAVLVLAIVTGLLLWAYGGS